MAGTSGWIPTPTTAKSHPASSPTEARVSTIRRGSFIYSNNADRYRNAYTTIDPRHPGTATSVRQEIVGWPPNAGPGRSARLMQVVAREAILGLRERREMNQVRRRKFVPHRIVVAVDRRGGRVARRVVAAG
jgi:hypothetical protein